MNVTFYREEPSERRVHRLTRPEAAVLAGLERDVWLRPKCRATHGMMLRDGSDCHCMLS